MLLSLSFQRRGGRKAVCCTGKLMHLRSFPQPHCLPLSPAPHCTPPFLSPSAAVAAGMMLVASGCLLVEGAYHDAAAYGSAGSGVLPPEEGGATPHASAAAATAAAAASSSWSLLSSMLGAAEAECAAAGFLAGIAFIWLSSKALDGWEQLKFSGFDGEREGRATNG